MNLLNLITNSALGQRLFAEDLADRNDSRKKLVARTELLKKQLHGISDKSIVKIDSEIKTAEAQLAVLREKRYALIIAANQERELLSKQIKAAEIELKRQVPAVLVSLQTAIFEKLKRKMFLQTDQATKARDLITELNSLMYCVDDVLMLKRALEIESEITAL